MNSTVLMVAAVQGFLLSGALIVKRSESRASNVYLSVVLILFSIELLFSWGAVSGYNNQPGAVPYWLLLSYLVIPPSIWLFFKHNSTSNFKFIPRHLWLFAPAAVEIVVALLRRYVHQPAAATLLAKITRSPCWFFYSELLPLLATIVVLILLGRQIRSISKQFATYNNPSVRQHVVKMYVVFAFFSLLALLWTAITFNNHLFVIVEVLFTAIPFVLGYTAFLKPDFFEMPKRFQAKKTTTTAFPNYNDEAAFLRLTQLFEAEQIYTRPKLSLKELGDELKLPAKYVSYLINTYACTGFNDFVNAYRVKEVLRNINHDKHKTLLGIAMDAGFNSKSTFNQVFKQFTGKSPSDYLV